MFKSMYSIINAANNNKIDKGMFSHLLKGSWKQL